uniref:F-box domain-containing protein n=1 Tax=Panagrellus redivivus TaxID=6233 RepID=A0A7E4UL36_PANRE
MNLLLPKTKKIPLPKLPYGFQERLIALAPLRILNDLGRVCSDVKMFRLFCPTAFDKVLITDNDNVYQEALEEASGDVLEEYHAVLHVDEIVEKKLHIYVADTLLLNCSIHSYKKVMPFITGPYTRLVLNGRITWKQVKWIIHPDIKKICIKAIIQIPGEFYHDFANFLVNQVRDDYNRFAIYHNRNLKTPLQEACRRHKRFLVDYNAPTHLCITTFFHDLVHFPEHCFTFCWLMFIGTSIFFGLLHLIGVDLNRPKYIQV